MLTKERCNELWKTKRYGCINPSPIEDKEIRDKWDTMGGYTCYMTAFFHIWNELRGRLDLITH